MDAFVLDVSACMPWCCEDETTQASEEMLEWAINGSALHVPALWTWEILNAVGVVIRRRRVSSDRGQAFLEQLTALNFKSSSTDRRLSAIAFSCRCSSTHRL
jgi:predicted nucleic acid-binding protein